MKFAYSPIALAVAVATNTAMITQQAYADDGGFVLEEIVVTAQKREQSLQDVPIAVTALGADDLEQSGSQTLSDIAQGIPSLTITQTQSESIGISLRGISSNDFGFSSEESIPVYLDGVYQGSGAAILGDLQDIAQIEVLKGPARHIVWS